MIKKILIGLLLIAGIFTVVVSMQPSDFRITRSVTVAAVPQVVFEQVDNLTNWRLWSPWEKIDPTAKKSFDGPPNGVGAMMSWAGNYEVGEGRMTITESRPNEFIKFKLDFLKPFEATSTAEFTFKGDATNSIVTWSMYGTNNFIGKAVGLFMDCEKMVGGQFEKGLSDLKKVVEESPVN